MFKLTDSVELDQTRTRIIDGGYMVCVARSVRTGIQDYLGSEVGKPEMDVVKVYRSPEEVFSDASLQSFSHAPITDNHPSEMVDASNWAQLAKGEVSTMAKKDSEWVSLPLILKDGVLISLINAGKRELSAGYTCDLDWTAGVTPEGEHYDAQQRNIRVNHLAVVDAARAGKDARINDGARIWGAKPTPSTLDNHGGSHMTDVKLQKVMFDGLSIEVTDQGAQAIAKLQAKIEDMNKEMASLDAKRDKTTAELNKELAKKDAEIDGLKSKVVDGVALDALVAARGDLVSKVRSFDASLKIDGLSDSAIKRALVDKRMPELAARMATRDASYVEAYYDGQFDNLMAELADQQDFRTVMANPTRTVDTNDGATMQQKAFDASVQNLNAWRTAKN